jgi:Fe-S oxidoreductase
MARPDDRPLRRLPQLAASKATLEHCVFCPKLCRTACPVSNAEPRETLTPWGKMSMAYFVANESVPLERPFAEPAWACTGCFACRERCDHKNDVTGTLFAARSALLEAGESPPPARRVKERFEERARVLLEVPGPRSADAEIGLLVGCEHARQKTRAAADALSATSALLEAKVSLVDECCGAPLLYAGDLPGFIAQGERFARATSRRTQLVVLDAGCAATLRVHHPARGHAIPAAETRVLHLAELAARHVERLGRVDFGGGNSGPVRWHDPCQLGRGLGVYEAPRIVLSRVLGRPPDEFERQREHAACSGAGGLVPVTMPNVSRDIARDRVDEHRRIGGGELVTACASSARSLGRAGAEAIDLATVIARAIEAR